MAKRGRPTAFNLSVLEKIKVLYSEGKTDAQVAKIIGVSVSTIDKWKGKHPEFLQALKEAKGIADDLVVASLFQRATGYSHPDEKIHFDKYGNIFRAKTTKHYPPDVTAQIFWLKNRAPEKWRESTTVISETPKETGPKKTFEQFCLDAGYPKPFEKQLEMRAFGFDETDARLLLGSRGYGKTDYVTILGLAYDIYINPESTNLIITKSKSRNTAITDEISKALIANGVQLERSNSSEIRVKGLQGKDHSVETITIRTSMRGRHPDRTLMDDPVTDEDVSEATRKLVKRRFDEVMKLCDNVIVIGQPAHKHDLYAGLRDNILTMEVPYGSIPELDCDLEAQRIAGVDEASIQASYFLKIVSEGTTPFDNIKYLDKFPPGGEAVAFIDPSHEGGDFTAISILRAHLGGVAVVGFTYKKAWNHCLDDMVKRLIQFNVKKLCFETNALGDMPIQILRELLKKTGIGVVGKKSVTNKHARIMAAGAHAHVIHLAKESDKTYATQVVEYEYGAKNDDAPDSLASCLEWIGLIRGKT